MDPKIVSPPTQSPRRIILIRKFSIKKIKIIAETTITVESLKQFFLPITSDKELRNRENIPLIAKHRVTPNCLLEAASQIR